MVQGPIAMKPRQVLLSSSSKVSSNGKPLCLTAEQRPLLLKAICSFLESSGFSKTLKKFLSEASLEKNSWKDCLLSLEHACCLYLDARSQNDADEISIGSDKKVENIVDNDENVKSKDKKKKKSGKDSSTLTAEVHLVKPEVALDTPGGEKSSKKAKDKKTKKGSEPAAEILSEDLLLHENKGSTEPEKDLKSKSKRKKNKASEVDDVEENGLVSNEAVVGEGTEEAKKSSKKRKKSSSEENKSEDLGIVAEDSKRRKTTDEPGKQFEHPEILPVEDDNDESSLLNKSSAKKQNGSTETRTQNAFQRVKADEVEFADEKLQDNSYWAKDGADIGYGAKAQEVLGQVRGRDFRHEKTKKKRGSYRGGLIDLQSHSVKFNYEDE